MKKIYVTILGLMFCLNAEAQTYVAIPDSNFVHYLKTIVPSAFKGDSLNKTSTLVTTYTQTINCGNRSIANLSGIQHFTSLTHLTCANNSLTSLPTLPNSITYLDCDNNSLINLPALPNSLTYMDCNTNQLTNLPTIPNSLTSLSCASNSLTSLPSLPSSLTSLSCGTNSLISLPTLPNSLTFLDCSQNSLTSLPTIPNLLTQLVCSTNSLTTLPALPNSLQTLYCYYNNISCFPTFPDSIVNLLKDPNPYNCFPNYIAVMGSDTVTIPLCAVGNTNDCPVAVTSISQISGFTTNISIYPNPASSVLNIECEMVNEKTDVTITDMLGNNVKQVPVSLSLSKGNTQHVSLNIADLNEGVYNLSISRNEGVLNKRVVIVK